MKLSCRNARRRGSVLIGVIIFSSLALLLVGSLIGWSLTERKLNNRNALRLEARNAAEALAEYGFSQIRQKFEARSTFSLNPDGDDALRLPPDAFWSGGNVVTAQNELVGGTIVAVTSPGSNLYYVDPNDPNNEFDPLKGKWIFRRDVAVVSKATVTPNASLGGSITSHVTERISVRGAPLFAHAIFYNMDLEIFPGPTMNIYGPVHANGNIYVSSQGSQLNFRGTVTASGNIYHAWKSSIAGTRGTGNEGLGSTPVRFLNRSGNLVDMKDGGGQWRDSLMGSAYNYGGTNTPNQDFRSYASQTWNGNLQTSSHGISNYTPVAIGKYEEDPTPGNGVDNSNNSGRAIIEPSNYPSVGDADYDRKMEIEGQKYANDAGIYIKVDPVTQQIVSISSRSKTNPAKDKVLTSTPTTDYKGIFSYNAFAYEPTNSTSGSLTPPTATGSGTTKTTTATQTATSDYKVTGGMYDRRRGKGVDLLEIDIGKLKSAVTEMAKAEGSRDASKAIGDNPTDAASSLMPDDWTGIVYVEVEGGPTTNPLDGSTNAGTVTPATQGGVAVRVINGKQTVPSHGTANEGLTIATNAPMYVKGSYNADGTTTSGGGDWTQSSANKPDTNEVPAALAADAITLLSEDFDDETTLKSRDTTTTTVSQKWKKVSGSWVKDGAATTSSSSTTTDQSVSKPGSSGSVEVAAALLMGLTPTYKDGVAKSSGGAHNFPRFLEDWNHATWIRGSLVSLFESRVAKEPWSTAYYDPPDRNWGFNDLFRQGRFPPGTPRVMSYRRVDFTDLSAAEYQTIKGSFGWAPAP